LAKIKENASGNIFYQNIFTKPFHKKISMKLGLTVKLK